jgi:hypothetical protein
MLKIDDLEQFSESFKTANAAIKKVILLVDDDDYAKFVKEEGHTKEEAILLTVIPSHTLAFKDKDNYKFNNYLHFFIIQKMDSRERYTDYVNTFKFTQPLIEKLWDYIYAKTDNFDECLFKHFDLSKATIDPVTDKQRTYGYSLSVPLKT